MNGQHFLIEAFHLNVYLTDGGLNVKSTKVEAFKEL